MKYFAIFALLAVATAATSQAQTISATIDASQTHPPITKYMYGQFVEHLGNLITGSFWDEMLDDRKFFNAITSRVPARPAGRGRGFIRRWMPIGPDDAVTMDASDAYVGDHSPMIRLDASGPRGIRQSGLAVRNGRACVGHIVLAGDSGVNLTVSLIWGEEPDQRQTIPIAGLTNSYSEFPLNFTPKADSDTARLEITGTGTGNFHIGTISLMPADNIDGFRPEVIVVLKQLHSGVYRFPGGNFVSNYDWHDGVGPRDLRPPRWDYAWNAVQSNDVGLDEFMQLFQLLDVEPYITVNAGFGDAYSAAQLVEYANGDVSTPMGALRAKNGHADPYGIKLWGIGNEMYGDWQLGVMPLDQFEIKHNLFARAMKKVDPTITLIASGAMPDEMTVTLQGKRLGGATLIQPMARGDWTGGMLSKCLPNIDMVSEHCYCTSGQHFDLASGQYVDVDANEPLVDWVRRPANRVQAKYEAYQAYLKLIPGLREKSVPISVDEYSYRRAQMNSWKPALSYAYQFDETFRHTDVFKMTAFTFATACISMNRSQAVLNPTGLVFQIYRDHFGTIPVDVSGNSPQPPPQFPVGGDQPAVNAGSDTYPLDVSAALSDDHKTLAVAIINPTESQQTLNWNIKGADLSGSGHVWFIAPSSVNATVFVDQTPQVKIEDLAMDSIPSSLTIAPISVNIYQFPVK